MAIYHLNVKLIQRAKGHSVVAAAAYRRAAKFLDEREGRTWDYRNKPDVIHSEWSLPSNAPDWLKRLVVYYENEPHRLSEHLWNVIENVSIRQDARLAREIDFALPKELTKAQNIALAREYIQDQLVSKGMLADWSVHWDASNPHVHVLLTTRQLTETGFGAVVSQWNQKDLLQSWRAKWAQYANFHLQLHQHAARIDHRSYQDQGIDLVPTIHLGTGARAQHARGQVIERVQAFEAIGQANLKKLATSPARLLKKIAAQTETFNATDMQAALMTYVPERSIPSKETFKTEKQDLLTKTTLNELLSTITHHEAVFSEKALAKALLPYTNDAEIFAAALTALQKSSSLIPLGLGDDGRIRYTTKPLFAIECRLERLSHLLRKRKHPTISQSTFEAVIASYQKHIGKTLTKEQVTVVQHITNPNKLACLVGRAGTGKSFSLGAAKVLWEQQGYRVLGVALSGIAADGLTRDAKINSRTIESFRNALNQQTLKLNAQDVIVMDEAGMTDSHSMLAVLEAVYQAKAKCVLVGDPAQLQPVGPGASFRALLERCGFATLQTVYRQQEAWQKEATVHFSTGQIGQALITYQQHGCIHLKTNDTDALHQLVHDWFNIKSQKPETPLNELLVMAHRNQDVALLNHLIRTERQQRQEIGEGSVVHTTQGNLSIAVGDRILFLKNNQTLGVSNGRFATVTEIKVSEIGKVHHFTVQLDGSRESIQVSPQCYRDFMHGYAATVHKVQGVTVHHSFVYAKGHFWNRHLTYVAMSRHRQQCHLYGSRTQYPNLSALIKRLSRQGLKDSVLDYPLAFAMRRGMDLTYLIQYLPQKIVQRFQTFTEKIRDTWLQFRDVEGYQAQALLQMKANQKLQQREAASVVADYVDIHRAIGRLFQQEKLDKTSRLQPSSIKTMETAIYIHLQHQRNAWAYQIMQSPEVYQLGLRHYDIDQAKLAKQALQYKGLLHIRDYQGFCETGKVVLRDKMAALICQDLKLNFPELKRQKFNVPELKKQAITHQQRLTKKSLQQPLKETMTSKTSQKSLIHETTINNPLQKPLMKQNKQSPPLSSNEKLQTTKESTIQSINKTTAILNVSTSLDDLILDYVNLTIQRSNATQKRLAATSPVEKAQYLAEGIACKQSLAQFASRIRAHPDFNHMAQITHSLELKRHVNEQSGYQAFFTRLQQGIGSMLDKQVILRDIRNETQSLKQVLFQKQIKESKQSY
ncbi:MAG: MobA/MobL family protein [Gammaproteobacteria bacterium]